MDLSSRSNNRRTQQYPFLPPEIFEEILSWLPVKSLLQFRCVSKSWRSLIDSQRFAQFHLDKSRTNPTCAHHRVILNSPLDNPRLRNCSLRSLVSEPVAHLYRFDDPVDAMTALRIVGVCNGLVCVLFDRRHFYLWNPSLRVSKQLPFLDRKLKHGYITKYGFGFDESSGDYKVYGIVSVFWVTGRFEAAGKVYSLKTNSWNQITERDGDSFGEAGKFVNGKLHWGSNHGWHWEWKVISFDLKSEKYESVPLPLNLQGNFHPSLGDFGGCLSMLCDYRVTRLDVWVMKEYGVQDSWNKMVTIPYPIGPEECFLSYLFYVSQNREVLLRFGSCFVVYSLDSNEFRYPQTVNLDGFHEPEVYLESLVSLVPDGERE